MAVLSSLYGIEFLYEYIAMYFFDMKINKEAKQVD